MLPTKAPVTRPTLIVPAAPHRAPHNREDIFWVAPHIYRLEQLDSTNCPHRADRRPRINKDPGPPPSLDCFRYASGRLQVIEVS